MVYHDLPLDLGRHIVEIAAQSDRKAAVSSLVLISKRVRSWCASCSLNN